MTTAPARTASTALQIADDQTGFTPAQGEALMQMFGLDNVPPAEVSVFFHVSKRSGLDPFARQLYLIGRPAKITDPQTGRETWGTKYTVQTGIDGYRVIGHREAGRRGESISMSETEWLHPNKEFGWVPAWSRSWGHPIAARLTIYRDGNPFPGLAMWDEYAQTTKAGALTKMWNERGAGQLAKCAEALAWRRAYPQDFMGIYTTEEMGQADNPGRSTAPVEGGRGTAGVRARMHAAQAAEAPTEVVEGELVEEPPVDDGPR